MCGIAGVISRDPAVRSRERLGTMAAALVHRGPDESGIGGLGDALLASQRLAVIDLVGGHQPMANEDGSILAVQNGEIYNYKSLRDELAACGHIFRTRSDTEVLPHAYEEWGDRFVERLRGMFALAIWDSKRERLVLARDRFGKKPLLYANVGESLLFASEIQGLLAHPAVDRTVDDEAISHYLTFGFVPPPFTAFQRIRKLAPGHVLVRDGGDTTTKEYWRLSFVPKLRITIDEAAEELRRRLDDAVGVRLISDVPIGAFLSGGLDSSTVVALMARHSEKPVKTFSIGFRDAAFDEREYARVVARHFGTEHHELVVDDSDTADVPMLVRHLGEPFADSSIVPSYQVARLTRQHVTVALNGDGGDELFAGYDRYKAALLARWADRAPAFTQLAARAARSSPEAAWLPRRALRARRFLAALSQPPDRRQLQWMGYFTGALRAAIAGERIASSDDDEALALLRSVAERSNATDPAEQFMAFDILMALQGDLLTKIDIATMAASLEARSPLLDHELAEFVASLPASYKLSARTSKVLLRRAMRGILPREILERAKMGFTAPVGAWLRGPLSGMFRDLVLSDRAAARGYISRVGAEALFDEHMSGRADRTPLLWTLLMLELWFRELVDAPSEISP